MKDSRRLLSVGLLLAAVISFVPAFSSTIIPFHDAAQMLTAFQILFSSLRFEGDLPHWIPHGRYGTTSGPLMLYISGIGYLYAVIGAVLSMDNTVLLFKLVVLTEYLLLCAGTISLCRRIYRSLWATAFVTCGVIFSFSWLVSLDGNFKTYYLLPWVLRDFITYFESREPRHFWRAGAILAFSAVGNIPYYLPLAVLLVTIFLTGMWVQERLVFPNPLKDRRSLFWLAVTGMLGISFVGFYQVNFEGFHFLSEGRDPITRKVFKEVFLTYAGVSKIGRLIFEFATGAHTHGDNTFYIGLAPLVLAPMSLLIRGNRAINALWVTTLFLLLFSFGGLVASASYHFPGMAYYRHIGIVFGQVKFLVLILAGFSLDQFLQGKEIQLHGAFALRTKSGAPDASGRFRLCLIVVIVIEMILSHYNSASEYAYVLFPRSLTVDGVLIPFLFRAMMYILVLGFVRFLRFRATDSPDRRRHCVARLVAVVFFIDMISFRVVMLNNWTPLDPATADFAVDLYRAKKLEYVSVRKDYGPLLEQDPKMNFLVNNDSWSIRPYVHLYALLGQDPCFPSFRTDMLPSGCAELLKSRGVVMTMWGLDTFPMSEQWLLTAVGCQAPKLRLISDSLVMFENNSVMTKDGGEPRDSVAVEAFGWNYLRARTRVGGDGAQWLYYADAYHPGWSATIDGTSMPLYVANTGFKAIRVPSGEHEVEFRFDRWSGTRFFYVMVILSTLFALYLIISALSCVTVSTDEMQKL